MPRLSLLGAFGALLLSSVAAFGQSIGTVNGLYGVGNGLGDGSSALFRIDDYLGDPTLIVLGETGRRMTDIAADWTNGTLYAACITNSHVYILSRDGDGIEDDLGDTGIPGLTALECRPNGELYAMGTGSAWLYTVDRVNGEATPIIYVGLRPAGDLALDTDGTSLYLSTSSGQLARIDLITKVVTIVGTFSAGNASAMYGMVIDPGGNLYTMEGTQNNYRSRLYLANKGTAQVTLVKEFNDYGVGLAGLTLLPRCAADTNEDCCVDDADITNVLLDFGLTRPYVDAHGDTDLNFDGVVDDADLTVLLLNYSLGCEGGEGGDP